MLHKYADLNHLKIDALDGELGDVHDLYFDDSEWVVRYIVVDTGGWIPGRKVLLAPQVIGRPKPNDKSLPVKLTRDEVRASPDIDCDRPVSRQQEEVLHGYYGWPVYWGAVATRRTWGVHPHETAAGDRIGQQSPNRPEGTRPKQPAGDPHLRSARMVTKYRIEAADGDLGSMDDLIIDTADWWVRYLVVKTGSILARTRVLVAPSWVEEIRWEDERVRLDLTREQIATSPVYDPDAPPAREYEEQLYTHYARRKYWDQGGPPGDR